VDSLVLDIGADIGALIIHTGPDLGEVEIEISPGHDPTTPRSHNVVHARHNRHGTAHAAVFPSVRAGDYTIWHPDGGAKARVTVQGGQITEHRW
jgi:hypothetical protein